MRLCLNMIVRQEAKTIERCLRSIAPHIACWAITDTGSSDGTPSIIQRVMAEFNLPGQLTFRPFDSFCNARNAAYEETRELDHDYVILSDADMALVATDPLFHEKLTAPVHSMPVRYADGKLEYSLTRIVRKDVPLVFRGVTHEYPDTTPYLPVLIDGAHFLDHLDGGTRGEKTERDIRLLVKGLKDEPGNVRYMFYLAQSYYFDGQREKAIGWYTKRIEAGPHGIPEEQFISGYRIAQCLQAMERWADFVYTCWDLWQKFPHRAEPMNLLALHYLQRQQNRLAYLIASEGAKVPQPRADALFVEPEVYKWRLRDTMAVAAFYLGRREEAKAINQKILADVPPSDYPRIAANLKLCNPVLPINNPVAGEGKKPLDLHRCLVVATIGPREPYILSIMEGERKWHLKIFDYGGHDRDIGAIPWKGGRASERIKWLFDSGTVRAEDYDYFWFPCDDVGGLSVSDVDRLFTLAHEHDLQLCQPSLAADSVAIGWGITINVPGSVVRRTNFVESMAPLFSAAAWKTCFPMITENLSGYGLDFVWAKLLDYKGLGIVDAVVAKHMQPHTSARLSMENGKTALDELHETCARHGIDFHTAKQEMRVIETPPAPVQAIKEFDLKRCLVVMTIGDREPAILKIRDHRCGFETIIIDHSKDAQERKIGAFAWRGHKWHNVAKLFTSDVVKAADYDYVWFPDDDIDISGPDAERLFALAHEHDLQLCQPSLSAESACTNWPVTKHVENSVVRRTNFVEIMAPLFRMDALAKCLSTFTENNCGWGLDFLWARILGDKDMGVIDAVQVRHTQMWGSPVWTLPSGKTPMQEMHETLGRHGLDFAASRAAVGVV